MNKKKTQSVNTHNKAIHCMQLCRMHKINEKYFYPLNFSNYNNYSPKVFQAEVQYIKLIIMW